MRAWLTSRQKHVAPDAIALLKEHDQSLAKACLDRLERAVQNTASLGDDWERKLEDDVAFVTGVSKGRMALRDTFATLANLGPAGTQATSILRFAASSIFIRESWEYLCSDPDMNERLHLVTGPVTSDGVRILSMMQKVKLERQSAAYVKGEDKDTHLKIVSLSEEHGHLLLAMFHSHMSHGAGSTHPSATDIANQKRFEKLGCEAIGAIFSLDGYVRFFSTDMPFELEVFGKGVEKVSDDPRMKVFHLLEAKEPL